MKFILFGEKIIPTDRIAEVHIDLFDYGDRSREEENFAIYIHRDEEAVLAETFYWDVAGGKPQAEMLATVRFNEILGLLNA